MTWASTWVTGSKALVSFFVQSGSGIFCLLQAAERGDPCGGHFGGVGSWGLSFLEEAQEALATPHGICVPLELRKAPGRGRLSRGVRSCERGRCRCSRERSLTLLHSV